MTFDRKFALIILLSTLSFFVSCNRNDSVNSGMDDTRAKIDEAVKKFYSGSRVKVVGISPRQLDDNRYLVEVILEPNNLADEVPVADGANKLPANLVPAGMNSAPRNALIICQKFTNGESSFWKARPLNDYEQLSLRSKALTPIDP